MSIVGNLVEDKVCQRPPSPRPSPPGEGESFAGLLREPAAGLAGITIETEKRGLLLFPLPRGEGQGEGERHPFLSRPS